MSLLTEYWPSGLDSSSIFICGSSTHAFRFLDCSGLCAVVFFLPNFGCDIKGTVALDKAYWSGWILTSLLFFTLIVHFPQ